MICCSNVITKIPKRDVFKWQHTLWSFGPDNYSLWRGVGGWSGRDMSSAVWDVHVSDKISSRLDDDYKCDGSSRGIICSAGSFSMCVLSSGG